MSGQTACSRSTFVQVFAGAVAAIHRPENRVGAALHRQVKMLAELGQPAEGVDQLVREILGMGGGKPDPLDAGDLVNLLEEVREGNFTVLLEAVGIDVLPDQGDFPNPAGGQVTDLGEDLPARPADLATADMGNDAVGAEIVAALHDGNKAADRRPAAALRKELQPGLPVEEFGLPAAYPLRLHAPDHLRQLVDVVGPEDKVEKGDLRQQLLPLLLGDAAADAEDQRRFLLLERLEAAEMPVDLALGLVADRAGIEQDKVGLGGGRHLAVAGVLQQIDDPLRVDDVHLAAEGFQIEAFFHRRQGHFSRFDEVPEWYPIGREKVK